MLTCTPTPPHPHPSQPTVVALYVDPSSTWIGVPPTVRFVFSNPSYLKAAAWTSLLSPLGMYLIESTSLGAEYKRVIKSFLHWCYLLRAPQVSAEALARADVEWPIVLSQLERLFPLYYATINQHLLVHLPEYIRMYGPLQCSHM